MAGHIKNWTPPPEPENVFVCEKIAKVLTGWALNWTDDEFNKLQDALIAIGVEFAHPDPRALFEGEFKCSILTWQQRREVNKKMEEGPASDVHLSPPKRVLGEKHRKVLLRIHTKTRFYRISAAQLKKRHAVPMLLHLFLEMADVTGKDITTRVIVVMKFVSHNYKTRRDVAGMSLALSVSKGAIAKLLRKMSEKVADTHGVDRVVSTAMSYDELRDFLRAFGDFVIPDHPAFMQLSQPNREATGRMLSSIQSLKDKVFSQVAQENARKGCRYPLYQPCCWHCHLL